MEKANKTDKHRLFRIIKNTVLAVLIALLTLVVIISMYSRLTGRAPSLFGYSLYRVSSGSMTPELEVGDVILVQGCDGNTVKQGDIVTYVATSGSMAGKMVTHRVLEAPYSSNGDTYVVTKGDANPMSDDPIKASQIEGKLLAKIGILRYLFDFFVTPWGLLALIALVIIAFFNEIVIFVKAILGIGYKPEPTESVDDIIARYQQENNSEKDSGDKTDNSD